MYVLAFFVRRSRLPWDSEISDIVKSYPGTTTIEVEVAFSCMAEIKSRLSNCCFEGLPSLFMDFYEAAASLSSDLFNYIHYIDCLDTLGMSYICSLQW